MVLKRSKYGLNTGATLRKPFVGARSSQHEDSHLSIKSVVETTEPCGREDNAKKLSRMLPSNKQINVQYSLKKQRRWELPGVIKSIINDNLFAFGADDFNYEDEVIVLTVQEPNGRVCYYNSLPDNYERDEDAPDLPTFEMSVVYERLPTGKTPSVRKKSRKSSRYRKAAILSIPDYSLVPMTPVVSQPDVWTVETSEKIDPAVEVYNRQKLFPVCEQFLASNRFSAYTSRNKSKRTSPQTDIGKEKSHIRYIAPPTDTMLLDHSYQLSDQPQSTQLPFTEVLVKGSNVEKTALARSFGKKYREVYCSPRTFVLNLSRYLGDEAKKMKFYLVVTLKDEVKDTNWCRVHCTGDFIARESSALSTVMQGVIYDLPTLIDLALSHRKTSGNSRRRVKSASHVRGTPTVRHRQVISFNQSQPLKRLASKLRKYYKRGTEGYVVFSYAQCPVCFEGITESTHHTAVLPCQHDFCDRCWNKHLDSAIYHGAVHISCMQYGCSTQLDSAFIMSMVEWSTYRLYETLNAERFLSRNKLKSCPNLDCGRVLHCDADLAASDGPITAGCKCGAECCFRCLKEPHWPLTCGQLTRYHALLRSDTTLSSNAQILPYAKKRFHFLFGSKLSSSTSTDGMKDCNWKHMSKSSQVYYTEARRHRGYKLVHVRSLLKKQCSRLLHTTPGNPDRLVINNKRGAALHLVLKQVVEQILATHHLLDYCCAVNIFKGHPKYCVPTISLLSYSLDVLERLLANSRSCNQAVVDKIVKHYYIIQSNTPLLVQSMSRLLGFVEPTVPELNALKLG